MELRMTLSEASASLTPLEENVVRQGPGGQAYELAPTTRRASNHDTPVTLRSRLKTKATHAIDTLAEKATLAGASTIRPFVRRPTLSIATVLGCAGLLYLLMRSDRAE